MERLLTKILSILGSFLLFGIGFAGIHELGHYQFAQWAGVPGGEIKLGLIFSAYIYPADFTPIAIQDFWMKLGGGLAVALFFIFFWAIRQNSLRFSAWDLDDTFALMAWGIGQLLYAFTEVMYWYYQDGIIPMSVGIAIALLIYGKRIIKWLRED